jgi:hypothetical protein
MLHARESYLLNIPRKLKCCNKFSSKFNENTDEKTNELASQPLEVKDVEVKSIEIGGYNDESNMFITQLLADAAVL